MSFQLATDKVAYRSGETAVLRFTITNTGSQPIYVSRDLGMCSRWTGYFDLAIFDHRDNKISRPGCDVFVTGIPDRNLKESFRSSDWKVLLPGEAYSLQEGIGVPTAKGRYHLAAELMPPGFPDHQMEMLVADGIRVLRSRHRAPLIVITVK